MQIFESFAEPSSRVHAVLYVGFDGRGDDLGRILGGARLGRRILRDWLLRIGDLFGHFFLLRKICILNQCKVRTRNARRINDR